VTDHVKTRSPIGSLFSTVETQDRVASPRPHGDSRLATESAYINAYYTVSSARVYFNSKWVIRGLPGKLSEMAMTTETYMDVTSVAFNTTHKQRLKATVETQKRVGNRLLTQRQSETSGNMN
jgi:hypothetical protein